MPTIASPAVVRATSLDIGDPLKADFRNFAFKVWMTLFGNPPSATMYEFAERLDNGPDRDILMGWRGLSKSFLTVAYAGCTLYRDPTEVVLTVSGSESGAKGNAALLWRWINDFEWLAHMKPTGMLRQSAQAFDVQGSRGEKSESFASMSLFGQITGRRASLIIPDDVETPNTSETQGDRDRLRTRYAELGGSLLKTGGKIKVLGTPQHEDTIYTELAIDKGYGMCIWPVYYPHRSPDPKTDEVRKYGPWLAPSILKAVRENPELAHTTVDPIRFPEDELQARKLEYGTIEFDRQFRLFFDAGQGVSTFLKLRDIPVVEIAKPFPPKDGQPGVRLKVPGEMTWAPSPTTLLSDIPVDSLGGDSAVYAPSDVGMWMEPEQIRLIVDPSGDGKDETSWGVLAQHLGRVGLVHLDARIEGFGEETMKAIAEDAARYGVHQIEIEKNYGGGMFGALLKPHLMAPDLKKRYPGWEGCTVVELNAGQVQKEVRILDSLTGVVTEHRLWIAAEVLRRDFDMASAYAHIEEAKRRFYRLTYQLTRITRKKGCIAHDDRLDMLASGVASFVESLKRHLQDANQEAKDQALQEEVEKMRAKQMDALGKKPSGGRLADFAGYVATQLTDSAFFGGRSR